MVIELEKVGERSIVYWEHGKTKEFVVCTGFDKNKPEGSKWYWGHYFGNLCNAVEYFNKRIMEDKEN